MTRKIAMVPLTPAETGDESLDAYWREHQSHRAQQKKGRAQTMMKMEVRGLRVRENRVYEILRTNDRFNAATQKISDAMAADDLEAAMAAAIAQFGEVDRATWQARTSLMTSAIHVMSGMYWGSASVGVIAAVLCKGFVLALSIATTLLLIIGLHAVKSRIRGFRDWLWRTEDERMETYVASCINKYRPADDQIQVKIE